MFSSSARDSGLIGSVRDILLSARFPNGFLSSVLPLREKVHLHSKTRFIAEKRKEQRAFKTRRKERIQKNDAFNDEQREWRDFSPSRVDDKV